MSSATAATPTATVEIEFGGHKVQVPKGGYYDRYRMNPDLDEVARDPAVAVGAGGSSDPDLAFFRKLGPKTLVESRVGPTYAPNFYYRTASVQLVFLAPLDRLRAKLPAPLEPMPALPGYGLVALTFYSYLVCDNDPYDEVSQLAGSLWTKTFYGYVLALPVNTEIARVRGVHGYQLPKWLASISLDMGGEHQHQHQHGRIRADVSSIDDGTPDLSLDMALPALKTIASQSAIVTNNAINKIDGKWSRITVLANPLLAGQCLLPRDVKLSRSQGPLSKLLDDELAISTLLRADVYKDAQMVLNMPTPLEEGVE
ncbi:hypothetical protein DV738_g1530, partial [Chaetothyriales sp. CBS 135597]